MLVYIQKYKKPNVIEMVEGAANLKNAIFKNFAQLILVAFISSRSTEMNLHFTYSKTLGLDLGTQ